MRDHIQQEQREIADEAKLIHELDMQSLIDQDEIVNFTRDFGCFVCGLIAWVRANAERHAFGPELCIADRLERVHEDAPVHLADRLERTIERRLAARADREFLHALELEMIGDRVERGAAIIARQVERMRELGIEPLPEALDS